jgi:excisionase family DNA binding protein
LTISQAARLTKNSRSTIYNWLREGKLEGFWLPNGARRIHRAALLRRIPPDTQKAGTPEGIPARYVAWKAATTSRP